MARSAPGPATIAGVVLQKAMVIPHSQGFMDLWAIKFMMVDDPSPLIYVNLIQWIGFRDNMGQFTGKPARIK